MNREEAIKLLALIKVAYPTAYRDMDNASKQATVNMWHTTFPTVPYPIMEMAFNRFRLASKFPPTVAEMCEELKHIYWKAQVDCYDIRSADEAKVLEWIITKTSTYKNDDFKDTPVYAGIGMLTSAPEMKKLLEEKNHDY